MLFNNLHLELNSVHFFLVVLFERKDVTGIKYCLQIKLTSLLDMHKWGAGIVKNLAWRTITGRESQIKLHTTKFLKDRLSVKQDIAALCV